MAAIVITADMAMTSPLPGNPRLNVVGDRTILTSDGFSTGGGTSFAGRMSDAALGGQPLRWSAGPVSGTPMITVADGLATYLPGSAASYLNYFDVPGPVGNREMEVGFRLVSPTTTSIFLDLFRTNDSKKMRCILSPSSLSGYVVYSPSGAGGDAIPNSSFKFVYGDNIRFSHNTKTNTSKVWVNNTLVVDSVSTPPELLGTQFGFAGTNSTLLGSVDNFILTEITV